MSTRSSTSFHRFALLTACATFLLLIAGGLVTSNDAGLAVPDWPLSYGSLLPPMVGGILYEHGHRMIAALVGLMTIGLAFWLWKREPRAWVRRLGYCALALVIMQGIFGGLTVLFYLPRPISIAHATMAQMFFATVAALALFTSRWWHSASAVQPAVGEARMVNLAFATVIAILVQLVLGACHRHELIGVTPHLLGAGVVLYLASWTARAVKLTIPEVSFIQRLRALLSGLIGMQIVLGFASWWALVRNRQALQPLPEMVGFTVAHLAVGALTLVVATLLWLALMRVIARVEHAELVLKADMLPAKLNEGGGQ